MRALLRRLVPVVRPRTQKPRLETKNGRLTFRYRVYDHQTGQARLIRHTFPPNTPLSSAEWQMQSLLARVNADNRQQRDAAPPTFNEFINGRWAAYTQTKGVKPATLYSYDSIIRNHLEPVLGPKLVRDITPDDIDAVFKRMAAERIKADQPPYSAKYRKNIYNILETMFDLAQQYKLTAESPVRSKIHSPTVKRVKKSALKPQQILDVLSEIPAEYKVLHWTIAVTALRIGELLGLQVRDVDLRSGNLHVDHDLWRGQLDSAKTEASEADIGLPQVIVDLLGAHLDRPEHIGPEDFVFCREDGGPLDPDHLRRSVLYPAMERVGIKIKPREHGYHIFRHSAGQIVVDVTKSVRQAQDLLRHTRMQTTADIYTRRSESSAAEAADIVAREIIGKLDSEKVQ